MSNCPVMVCGEAGEGGEIHPITLELLGAGRKLADDLSTDLSAVLIGDKLGEKRLPSLRQIRFIS